MTFTGGEATLRKDFHEIVRTAKENGLITGVLSNGIIWSQEFVDKNRPYRIRHTCCFYILNDLFIL